MKRQRVRIVVEVDLDGVPGWGNDPEDWRRLIESRITEDWYHPEVAFGGYQALERIAELESTVSWLRDRAEDASE